MVQKANITFLLVDQDRESRKTTTDLLLNMNYRDVIQSINGTEAWSMITTFNVNFIFCAHDLPDMKGLSLLRILQASYPDKDIHFILVVREVTESQVIEAGEAGVTDIITYPVTKINLRKKINNALNIVSSPKDNEFKKRYNEALGLMEIEMYKEALEAFEKSLTVHEAAETFYNMGFIKTVQGKYEEALQSFRRATQIDKSHVMSHKKMGETFMKLGKDEEARDCLEKAGDILMGKSMDVAAESVLQEALRIDPTSLNVYNSLGIIYRRQNKYKEAIINYKKALKVHPKDERIYFNLARVYYDAKNIDDARKTLIRAVKLKPDFSEAQEALIALNSGKVPDWFEVVEVSPN